MTCPLAWEIKDILEAYPADIFPPDDPDPVNRGRNQALALIRSRLNFALDRSRQVWTMHELDEYAKGFGFVTSDAALSTVNEFLEYLAERQSDQERFERELDRSNPV